MRELVRKLVETYGPSGVEDKVREVIRAQVGPFADEVKVDALGSLIVRKKGGDGGKRIILAAHMDEIGVIVSYIDKKGFARFAQIGGVYPLNAAVFGDGTVGVIGVEEKRENASKIPGLGELYIDVGATSAEDCPVNVGDSAAFMRPFEVQGPRLISKAMDDRIGCAVLIETLRRLKDTSHDLYFVFSVQEEVGLRGARTSAFGIDPDLAIAVDVTATGDTPESHTMAVELGKGPAVKVQDGGMIAHPKVKDLMVRQAKKAKIPYQMEVLLGGSTDAAAMQLTRAGVPAGCLSIPCRYVHTPSEMVDERDVENGVRLLLEILKAA
jgi:putative aminopeptidase FrvX